MYFSVTPSIRNAIFLLCLLAISISANAKNNKVILAIGETDWAPYHYHDLNGKLTGIDINLLQKTLHLMGKPLKVINSIPLRRLTSANQKLGFNMLLGGTYTKQRAEFYYFSNSYRKEVISIYYTDARFDEMTSLLDFLNHSETVVGAANSAAYYGDEFENIRSSYPSRIVHLENANRRVAQLLKGQVSFFIGDAKNIDRLLSIHGRKGIKKATFNLVEQDVCFMFQKSQFNEQFVTRFNEALEKVQALKQ